MLSDLETPNAERHIRRIKPEPLILAKPHETVPTHQVGHGNCGLVVQSEFPKRHLNCRLLYDVGIKADGDQDHAVVMRITFSVQNDLVAMGGIESEAKMRLQRRMLAPNSV